MPGTLSWLLFCLQSHRQDPPILSLPWESAELLLLLHRCEDGDGHD